MHEPPGLREFVESRSPGLLRTARLLTGDRDKAQDLVQASFVKVWLNWTKIASATDPDQYVRRMMFNEYLKGRRRRWHGEISTLDVDQHVTGEDDVALLAVEDRVELGRALAKLSRRQRAVLVLRFLEDFSERDTALALNVSPGTVKSQTSKALGRLRSELGVSATTLARGAHRG
jgi:RNA polymerase sigma-70 factor (sigma-E family)